MSNETMGNPVVDAVDEIREYPSHMIEEEDTLEDHTEDLNPFEEEEAVEEEVTEVEFEEVELVPVLETPVTPPTTTGAVAIDLETLPQGTTAQEVATHYQTTGSFMVRSDTSIGVVLTPQPVPEMHPIVETAEELSIERAVQVATAKRAEKEYKDDVKKRERKRLLLHTSYVLKSNEIMLLVASDGSVEMIKSDYQRSGKISKLQQDTTKGCPITGQSKYVLNNGLMFDKNMNPLTANGYPFREKSVKGITRIDTRQTTLGLYNTPASKKRWIIIDKEAFVASNGKKFKVKHRVGFTILETLKIKRKILNQIKEAKAFIEQVKELVGGVYDEEHYEIVYNLNFGMHNPASTFYIYLQFPNLVVSNSIEMTHNIENMITRMDGSHYKGKGDGKDTFSIDRKLRGMRTKYSPEDAYYGYHHSHLSTGSCGWNGFCMGDEHFMSRTSTMFERNTSFIELEAALIGVLDHISWESLEGGPYIKMEDIGGGEAQVVNSTEFHRTLKIHSRSAIRRIFNSIKKKDLTLLKKAFSLKMQSNKEVTYVLDKRIFAEQFSKMYDPDVIRSINRDFELNEYMYVPSEDHFISVNGRGHRAKDWDSMVTNARAKIGRFPIVYMNGKYIRPQVIVNDIPDETVTKREVLTLHPKILFYVANIIHYHLLNELKNVR